MKKPAEQDNATANSRPVYMLCLTSNLNPQSKPRPATGEVGLKCSSQKCTMKRRIVKIAPLLAAVFLLLFLIFRDAPSLKVTWEYQLPEREYVLCLAVHEDGERPFLVAGIQRNNYGSRDFDNYIVCFDLATGGELWKRHEAKDGNMRGGKRPTSIEFDRSGNLIVGWDYFAVGEGDFELVSKLSAKDGSLIWDWVEPSKGSRSLGSGYSHSARIRREGVDILVNASRSVGTVSGSADMRDGYFVIDSTTGKPLDNSASTAEAKWRSRENPLAFTAPDGNEVSWGRHIYGHSYKNWLRWRKDDGVWLPESHWEMRERVQVTQTPTRKTGSPKQHFIGLEQERAISLLYLAGEEIPSAALLIDMSADAPPRKWRVVRVTGDYKIGQQLAYGVDMSPNFDGPMRLTKSGSLIISGSLLNDQSPQRITVWK